MNSSAQEKARNTSVYQGIGSVARKWRRRRALLSESLGSGLVVDLMEIMNKKKMDGHGD